MAHTFPYEHWERLVSDERRAWQDPEVLLDLLDPGKGEVWADVGCGPGFFTLPLARRVRKVYAVDIQAPMLGVLRQRVLEAGLSNVELLLSGAHRIPLPEHSVDGTLLINVFHEVEDAPLFFADVVRITRRKIVLVDWKRETSPVGPPLEERLSELAVYSFLTAQPGVEAIQAHDIYPYHYVLEVILQSPSTRSYASGP